MAYFTKLKTIQVLQNDINIENNYSYLDFSCHIDLKKTLN